MLKDLYNQWDTVLGTVSFKKTYLKDTVPNTVSHWWKNWHIGQ